jgi:hypothetical protein
MQICSASWASWIAPCGGGSKPSGIRVAVASARTTGEYGRKQNEAEPELPAEIRRVINDGMGHGDSHTSEEAIRFIKGMRWVAPVPPSVDLVGAQAKLDAACHGMEAVKGHVLDYFASSEWSRQRGAERLGKVLCMLGPAGVGKTAIAEVISEVMGRTLIRMPMGGVDDVFLIGADQAYNRGRPGEIARRIRESGPPPQATKTMSSISAEALRVLRRFSASTSSARTPSFITPAISRTGTSTHPSVATSSAVRRAPAMSRGASLEPDHCHRGTQEHFCHVAMLTSLETMPRAREQFFGRAQGDVVMTPKHQSTSSWRNRRHGLPIREDFATRSALLPGT